MKVRALRGVCIGVGRHLNAGDSADLDSATVIFLAQIGAVERIKDAPIEPVKAEPQPETAIAKPDEGEAKAEPETKSEPAKAGKKEK
jgi:hypothetical protein